MGASEIWRGGATSNRIKREDGEVSIHSGGSHAFDKRRGVNIKCTIPSKGGGQTEVKIWVHPDDFEKLLNSMMKSSPDKIRETFESAGIKLVPKYD